MPYFEPVSFLSTNSFSVSLSLSLSNTHTHTHWATCRATIDIYGLYGDKFAQQCSYEKEPNIRLRARFPGIRFLRETPKSEKVVKSTKVLGPISEAELTNSDPKPE